MKKALCLTLAALLLLSFAACVASQEETTQPAATTTAEPTTEAPTTEVPTTEVPETTEEAPSTEAATEPAPTEAPSTTAKPTQAPTEPPKDLCAIAHNYIGSSVSALYAAIGYPNSTEYGHSCDGDYDDGILYYSGFTVYTARYDNGSEVVVDVWP